MQRIFKNLIAGFVLAVLAAGCAAHKPKPSRTELQSATDKLATQSQVLNREQDEILRRFEHVKPAAPAAKPVQPKYDPLEGIRVTLDVEDTSVHQVLRALAEQVNLDLVISPSLVEVPNRISVHFKNAEASRVLKQVLRIADVSGTIKDGMLIVNPMEQHVFDLDFMESATTMKLSAGGDVLGASRGTLGVGQASAISSGNALTGEFSLQGSSAQDVNPYDALEDMLKRLIGTQGAQPPASNVQAARSVKEVSAFATVDTARQSDTPMYSLNRITGTLYVRARPSVMKTVTELIDRYREVLSRQILIQAQVLEITLNHSFQYGVDWNYLKKRVASNLGPTGATIGGVNTSTPNLTQGTRSVTIPSKTLEALGNTFMGLSYFGNDFGISVNLLKQFGDVTVLSNPTLRTKHGQPALISVGTSNTFVSEAGSTVVPAGVGSTVTQNVQTSSVFDGLMVGLLPFIGDDGEITLIVHPIQSSVDPKSLELVDVGGQSRISLPKVDLKELSTTIRLHSGDMVILGGLIDRTKGSANNGVPGISRIPIFGKLFESSSHQAQTRELVIVLKVTEV
ncbi:MAG: pilus (MSHA type) biogenesis protein MshL [Arenicellales bacterium]